MFYTTQCVHGFSVNSVFFTLIQENADQIKILQLIINVISNHTSLIMYR